MQSSLQPNNLRQQLRQQRRSLTAQQQQQAAELLLQRLLSLPCYQQAQSLALYLASDGEISAAPIAEHAISAGKKVYVPVLEPSSRSQMRFQQISDNERWQANRYNISEPVWQPQLQVDVQQLDLILLPLVGFDATGARVGMGGGYYDRALAGLAGQGPLLIGLAHACQQVQEIKQRHWDIPLDMVLTDSASFVCSTRATAQICSQFHA